MLTKRQKQILHRAIDSARDRGSAKYVDEFGLPVDVAAFVAMYEGISPEVYKDWEGSFDEIHKDNKAFTAYYWNKGLQAFESYMSEDTRVNYQGFDNPSIHFFRPGVDDPILVALQKLWDMSRVTRGADKAQQILSIRSTMHSLVDQLPTSD